MADSNDTGPIATGEGAAGSRLMGIGAYRPERVVSNEEIAQRSDSSSARIDGRRGTLHRRFAEPEESVIYMAGEAAKRAITSAGVDPELIDLVILCTSTYEAQVPHAAPKVASAFGRNGIAAFDITAG